MSLRRWGSPRFHLHANQQMIGINFHFPRSRRMTLGREEIWRSLEGDASADTCYTGFTRSKGKNSVYLFLFALASVWRCGPCHPHGARRVCPSFPVAFISVSSLCISASHVFHASHYELSSAAPCFSSSPPFPLRRNLLLPHTFVLALHIRGQAFRGSGRSHRKGVTGISSHHPPSVIPVIFPDAALVVSFINLPFLFSFSHSAWVSFVAPLGFLPFVSRHSFPFPSFLPTTTSTSTPLLAAADRLAAFSVSICSR